MTKGEILKQIRKKCFDCSAGQESEVKVCEVSGCPLWELRMGKDPRPNPRKSQVAKERFGKPEERLGWNTGT